MAIYPGGTFKPTTWGGRTPRTKGQRGILHVAVSNAADLPPWSVNTWHFYVNKAGQAFQYVDTDWCAWASIDANGDAISIETQGGMGTTVNTERWTDAQAARIADIMRWVHDVEGTPLALLPDSMAGRRGWGPHRLGISPWRVSGGQVWSSSNGKECPGDAKVAQVSEVLALALGADMPLTAQDLTNIAAAVVNRQIDGTTQLWVVLRDLHQQLPALAKAVAAIPTSPAPVDPKALAAAIVAALPAAQAQQVVDELGKRLNTPAA